MRRIISFDWRAIQFYGGTCSHALVTFHRSSVDSRPKILRPRGKRLPSSGMRIAIGGAVSRAPFLHCASVQTPSRPRAHSRENKRRRGHARNVHMCSARATTLGSGSSVVALSHDFGGKTRVLNGGSRHSAKLRKNAVRILPCCQFYLDKLSQDLRLEACVHFRIPSLYLNKNFNPQLFCLETPRLHKAPLIFELSWSVLRQHV